MSSEQPIISTTALASKLDQQLRTGRQVDFGSRRSTICRKQPALPHLVHGVRRSQRLSIQRSSFESGGPGIRQTVQCWAVSRVGDLFPFEPRARGLNPQTFYPNHESGARFIPTIMTECASKKYPAPSGSYLGPYIPHPMNALKGAQNPSACELLDATISSTPTKQPVINFGKRDASFVSLLLFRASTVAAYPFSVGSLSRGSLVCF